MKQSLDNPRTRAAVGSVSLLLVVALTVATPSGTIEPTRSGWSASHSVDPGGAVRHWSDTLARAVRDMVATDLYPVACAAAQTNTSVRPDLTIDELAAPTDRHDRPGVALLVIGGLLDLPPPIMA
jgi:hypothetical protein